MILFHLSYDIFIVYGVNPNWYSSLSAHIWQQFICYTFILISGVSFHFSRNNLKRSIMINLYGLLITLVTAIFLPSELVLFGILNLIGCSILLTAFFHKQLKRIPPVLGMLLFFVLFSFTRNIDDGYLGFNSLFTLSLPDSLYQFKALVILGFPYPGFRSSDYFPIFPWIFLFLTGYYLWDIIAVYPKVTQLLYKKIPILSYIGQKSIWIYLLHQPIAMLVCELFFNVLASYHHSQSFPI